MSTQQEIRRANFAQIVIDEGGQAAVARKMNRDRNQVWQWLREPSEAGSRNIGSKTAREIEATFDKPEGWLDAFRKLNDPAESVSGARPIGEWDGRSELPETHKGIRRLEYYLSAGSGNGVSEESPSYLTPNVFRSDFLKGAGWSTKTHFSMYVAGDSMEPNYPDGSTVVVDITDREPQVGKARVFAIKVDGEPRLKRLQRLPSGTIRVSSDNARLDYAPFEVAAESKHDLEIIGRVVHLSTKID